MSTLIKSTLKIIPMSQILRTPDGLIDVSSNVRERDAYNMERLRPLLEDIRQAREAGIGFNGVRDAISVMEEPDLVNAAAEPGGKAAPMVYRIIQGHRRAVCLDIDKIDKVQAFVYPKLDQQQYTLLLIDHGNREGLNLVEVWYSIRRGLEARLSEKQIATQMRGLLANFYKITPKQQKQYDAAADKEVWLRDRYKGVIQTHKRAFDAPYVVHTEWEQKLRTNRVWPRAEEVKEASEIFREESAANALYTKENPGPKFLAFWKTSADAQAEAEAAGNDGKKTSSKGRKELQAMYDNTSSPMFKMLIQNIMGNPKVTDKDVDDILEVVQRELEKASLVGPLLEKVQKLALRGSETPAPAPAENKSDDAKSTENVTDAKSDGAKPADAA